MADDGGRQSLEYQSQHGAIASNRIMNWQDINGQVIRRLFVHMFRKPPVYSDGEDLVKSLDRCRGAALKKMNLAYRAKCASHGPGQLKDCDLPANVAAIHQEIRRELNPLFAFLEGDDVKLNPNYYICASEFRKGFIYFCHRSGLQGSSKLPSATDSFFADTLVTKGLRFVTNPADLPVVAGGRPPDIQGNNRDGSKTWIVGMCMRAYEGGQPNYVKPTINNNGYQGNNRGFPLNKFGANLNYQQPQHAQFPSQPLVPSLSLFPPQPQPQQAQHPPQPQQAQQQTATQAVPQDFSDLDGALANIPLPVPLSMQ
jgi:hypothetical protein